MRDLKVGVGGEKPPLELLTYPPLVYEARVSLYGDDKYKATGNYLRLMPDDATERDKAKALMGYLGAAMRHIAKIQHALISYLGSGAGAPATLADAVYSIDDEADGSGFPPSGLPHICGARKSTAIFIDKAIIMGLLPADPGNPWRKGEKS